MHVIVGFRLTVDHFLPLLVLRLQSLEAVFGNGLVEGRQFRFDVEVGVVVGQLQ